MRGSTKIRLEAGFKVNANGCWIWQKGKGSGSATHRYGRIYHEGQPINAHRASWLVYKGEIPHGLEVLHHCDVPLCVNPAHLFVGTKGDNMRDKAQKGRAINGNDYKTHCPKGHEYSDANTYLSAAGKRHCRICREYDPQRDRERARLAAAAWRAAHPEKARAAWKRANDARRRKRLSALNQ